MGLVNVMKVLKYIIYGLIKVHTVHFWTRKGSFNEKTSFSQCTRQGLPCYEQLGRPYITERNSTCLPGVLGEITFLGVWECCFLLPASELQIQFHLLTSPWAFLCQLQREHWIGDDAGSWMKRLQPAGYLKLTPFIKSIHHMGSRESTQNTHGP